MYAGKIFHEALKFCNLFNDILDKKRIIPHMEIFTLERPAPYTLEFPKSGYEWVLDVNISSRTAHPDSVRKNISIYPDTD